MGATLGKFQYFSLGTIHYIPFPSRGLVADKVWISSGNSSVPCTGHASGLDIIHCPQSVSTIQLFAVEFLIGAHISGDEVHRLLSGNGMESSVLGIDFGFGGAVPDFASLRHGWTNIVLRVVDWRGSSWGRRCSCRCSYRCRRSL